MIQDMVQDLAKELKLSEDQARKCLGLLLKFCQKQLAGADFQKITEVLGQNWQNLLTNLPSSASGLFGKIAGASAIFGEKAAKVGSYTALLGNFKSIGVDMGRAQKFVEATLRYLKEKGGPQVNELLERLLK